MAGRTNELVAAWTTTWAIVERLLKTWTPDMLDEPMSPDGPDAAAHLTRRSLIHRMMFHEAYHAGEIALIQGIHGRTPIDLWPAGYHTVEAAAARAAGE
ncbi:MAG TPA: DinB family protein [Candidatus Limnocylindrales bacterium]|nr:DinB family protein [Candidatus Limnocylindrales bacterium]